MAAPFYFFKTSGITVMYYMFFVWMALCVYFWTLTLGSILLTACGCEDKGSMGVGSIFASITTAVLAYHCHYLFF